MAQAGRPEELRATGFSQQAAVPAEVVSPAVPAGLTVFVVVAAFSVWRASQGGGLWYALLVPAAAGAAALWWLTRGLVARKRLRAELVAALSNTLTGGTAQDPRTVVLKRWKGRFPGKPDLIVLRHSRRVRVGPDAAAKICRLAESVVGCRYTVSRQSDAGRRRVELRRRSGDAPATPVEDRINEVLASGLGEGAKVTGIERDGKGDVTTISFTWPPRLAVRASGLGFQNRIGKTLGACVGRPVYLKWILAEDRAESVEPLPDRIPRTPRDPRRPWQADFARLRDGSTATWDLNASDPHVLIVGRTGSGKSVLLRTILTGLPQGASIYLVDPKIISLKGMDIIPGVVSYARTAEEMAASITAVHATMMERFGALDRDEVTRDELDPLVLLIDEGEELALVLNSHYKTVVKPQAKAQTGQTLPGNEHPAMDCFRSILRLGREGRVHVILATQQADARWLGGTGVRGNFSVRIALSNVDPVSSQQMFNSLVAVTGLEPVKGRAWIAANGGYVQQGQVLWTPEFGKPAASRSAEDRAILEAIGIDADAVRRDATKDGGEPVAAAPAPPPAAGDNTARADMADMADAAEAGQDADPVRVVDLIGGERILLEADDGDRLVTVESVDCDEDPDCLLLSWADDDGEAGEISVPTDATVQVLQPLAAGEPWEPEEPREEAADGF